MADVRKEFELAALVVAICKVDASYRDFTSQMPFDKIWDEVKSAPLGALYSQAKIVLEANKKISDEERCWIYRSLGKFFIDLLEYAKAKGVILKVRNEMV